MHISRFLIDRRIDNKVPDGHPCHMLLPVKLKEGMKVEVTQCSCLTDGAGCSIMKIIETDSGYKESDYLGISHHIMGECSVIKVKKDLYLATAMNNNCRLAKILSESGCFLTSAVPQNDNEIEWTVFAPNKTYIKNLIARMKSEGYGVKMIIFELMEADMLLTPRQEEVIKYAFEHGYYESPKLINIDDLCKQFDCSKSTMSIIIRYAERKLIGSYLNLNRNNKYY